ncbi:MAG: dolichyl-phosphate-mannose-protein mannosyltransferase [Actinomycetota bacterium]|nr:dolichyl-phosphate-mannose-protein mannosyltransferase [Actinomycetota bacterium]
MLGLYDGPVLMTARAQQARERLVRPMPDDGIWGWVAPAIIAVFAGILRFWRLGTPKAFIFDETYYAKDAYSLLKYGVEQNFVKGTDPSKDLANERILSGDVHDIFAGSPAYVVHPPGGKWVIALGEWMFGINPFGWRFMVALLGTLSVLMIARIGRRLFRSTLLGCIAGLLLSVDGLHYVHSRTALLDPILMFWALAAFGALLIDRDKSRRLLADRLDDVDPLGPYLGLRPWRIAAGVFLGLACATKWSGLWFIVVFGLMTVLWDLGARRSAGVPRPYVGALVRDAGTAFASLVFVALAVYLASWTGWFLGGHDAYLRYWAQDNPGPSYVPDALRSLWHYHHDAWNFHRDLHSFHPYRSSPWGWIVLARPVSYYYESPGRGTGGCDVDKCSQAITALGTPAIWWAGTIAVFVLLYVWIGRRDWRAGAILAGIAGGYLPWFFFQGRTIYSFYAVAFVPYVVLAVTMCLGLMLGPPLASARRRQWGAAAVGGYLLVAVANFAWLLPVLSAQVVPYTSWAHRMWFTSWI